MSANPPRVVRTMLCSRDVPLALRCFGSLLRHSAQPLRLVLHEDGSLTSQDVELLLASLAGASIVYRKDSHEPLETLLANYPNARKFRRDCVFSIKLLDTLLLSEEDMAYCDSDIYFLRPFTDLFRWPDRQTSALFMVDPVDNCYSVRPWHLSSGKIQLVRNANTGLMFFRKSAYDLDLVEWILGREEFKATVPQWLEPTCWVALGQRVGARVWCPRQIVHMRPQATLTSAVVAGHFVSAYRHHMDEILHAFPAPQEVVALETQPAQELNALQMGFSNAKRVLRNKIDLAARKF